MLPIENDFSQFDRLDWLSKIEVGIGFLVELLAHISDKTPDQIIKILCLCEEDLPQFRYDEEEFEAPSDPQWMLYRYHIILHTKVLLSNTLESSAWGLVQGNSLSCREEIKYKSATYPSASNEEIIFQSDGLDADGIGRITRIVEAPRDLPFDECWTYRYEVEQYLASNRAFDGWLDLLPISVKEHASEQVTSIGRGEQPIWILRKAAGGFWDVGNEANPEKLRAVNAFMDIAYAISAQGKDLNPLDLPGNQSEERDNVESKLLRSPEFGLNVDNVGGRTLDDQAWTGFGSDDVADSKARKDFERERQKLLNNIEIARETGNSAEADELQGRVDKLEHFIGETTMPGGKPKKLSTGDPIEKATAAARDRKATAIRKIDNAGLHDMAKHLDNHYHVGKRVVTYLKGHPFPEWIT